MLLTALLSQNHSHRGEHFSVYSGPESIQSVTIDGETANKEQIAAVEELVGSKQVFNEIEVVPVGELTIQTKPQVLWDMLNADRSFATLSLVCKLVFLAEGCHLDK